MPSWFANHQMYPLKHTTVLLFLTLPCSCSFVSKKNIKRARFSPNPQTENGKFSDHMIMDDKIINNAIQFLMDCGEQEAANVLKTCCLESCDITDRWMNSDEHFVVLSVKLHGPELAYRKLSNPNHPLRNDIIAALGAVLPKGTYINDLNIRLMTLDPSKESAACPLTLQN